jgi:hypothetical protein
MQESIARIAHHSSAAAANATIKEIGYADSPRDRGSYDAPFQWLNRLIPLEIRPT